MAELKKQNMMKKVALLEGRAISIERNLSFHPIISLLKHRARITENDNETAALGKLEKAVGSVCHQETEEILPLSLFEFTDTPLKPVH